jgi:drug/metabolite transporter (DMT)-like permease
MAMAIPVSAAVDMIWGGEVFSWYYLVATGGVLHAVVAMNIIEYLE